MKKIFGLMAAGICAAGMTVAGVPATAFAEDVVEEQKVSQNEEDLQEATVSNENDTVIKPQQEDESEELVKVTIRYTTDGVNSLSTDRLYVIEEGHYLYNETTKEEVMEDENGNNTFLVSKGCTYSAHTVGQMDKYVLVNEFSFSVSEEGVLQITDAGDNNIAVNGTEIVVTLTEKEKQQSSQNYPVIFKVFSYNDKKEDWTPYYGANTKITLKKLPYANVHKAENGDAIYDMYAVWTEDYMPEVIEFTEEEFGTYEIDSTKGNSVEVSLPDGMYNVEVSDEYRVGADIGTDRGTIVVLDGKIYQMTRKGTLYEVDYVSLKHVNYDETTTSTTKATGSTNATTKSSGKSNKVKSADTGDAPSITWTALAIGATAVVGMTFFLRRRVSK